MPPKRIRKDYDYYARKFRDLLSSSSMSFPTFKKVREITLDNVKEIAYPIQKKLEKEAKDIVKEFVSDIILTLSSEVRKQ